MTKNQSAELSVGGDYEARYLIVNGASTPITEVCCIHGCAELAWSSKISALSLAPGEASFTQVLHSRSWYADFWQVSFFRQGCLYFNPGTAEFDVPSKNDGCLVIVSIYDEGFQVIPARASSTGETLWPTKYFSYRLPFGASGAFIAEDQSSTEDSLVLDLQSIGRKKLHGRGVNEDILGHFVVINATNDFVTDVVVEHECNGKKDEFKQEQMSKDAVSVLKTMTSVAWFGDYWNIAFTTALGEVRSRQGKRCDYTNHDSSQVCLVILYEDSFSIVIPATGNCTHSQY